MAKSESTDSTKTPGTPSLSKLSSISVPRGGEQPASSPPLKTKKMSTIAWFSKHWQQFKRRLSSTGMALRSKSVPNTTRFHRATERRSRSRTSSVSGPWRNDSTTERCGFTARGNATNSDSEGSSGIGVRRVPESVQKFDIHENTLKTKFRQLRDQYAQGKLKKYKANEVTTGKLGRPRKPRNRLNHPPSSSRLARRVPLPVPRPPHEKPSLPIPQPTRRKPTLSVRTSPAKLSRLIPQPPFKESSLVNSQPPREAPPAPFSAGSASVSVQRGVNNWRRCEEYLASIPSDLSLSDVADLEQERQVVTEAVTETPPKPPRSSAFPAPSVRAAASRASLIGDLDIKSRKSKSHQLLLLSDNDVEWFEQQEQTVIPEKMEMDTATQVSLSSEESPAPTVLTQHITDSPHPCPRPRRDRHLRIRCRPKPQREKFVHLTVYNQAPHNRFVIEPCAFGLPLPTTPLCPCHQRQLADVNNAAVQSESGNDKNQSIPVEDPATAGKEAVAPNEVVAEPTQEALAYLQETLRTIGAPNSTNLDSQVPDPQSEPPDGDVIGLDNKPAAEDTDHFESTQNKLEEKVPQPVSRQWLRRLPKRRHVLKRYGRCPVRRIIYIRQSTSDSPVAVPTEAPSKPTEAGSPERNDLVEVNFAPDERNHIQTISHYSMPETVVEEQIAASHASTPCEIITASHSYESFQTSDSHPEIPVIPPGNITAEFQQMLLISNLANLTAILNKVTTEKTDANLAERISLSDRAEQTHFEATDTVFHNEAVLLDLPNEPLQEPRQSLPCISVSAGCQVSVCNQSAAKARKRRVQFIPTLSKYHKHRNFHCDECRRKKSFDRSVLTRIYTNRDSGGDSCRGQPQPVESSSKPRVKQVTFAESEPARLPPEMLQEKLSLLQVEKGFVIPTLEVLQHLLHIFQLDAPLKCHPKDVHAIWEAWKSQLSSLSGKKEIHSGIFAQYAQFSYNRFIHFIKMYCTSTPAQSSLEIPEDDSIAAQELFQAGVLEIPVNRPKAFTFNVPTNRDYLRDYLVSHFRVDADGRSRSIFRQKFPFYLHLYKSGRTRNLSDDEVNDVKLMLHLFRLDRCTLFSKSETKLIDDIMRTWNSANAEKLCRQNVLDVHRVTQRWLVETAYINYRQSLGAEQAMQILGLKYLNADCHPKTTLPKESKPERSPVTQTVEESLKRFQQLNKNIWSVCRHTEETSPATNQQRSSSVMQKQTQSNGCAVETGKEIWKSTTVTLANDLRQPKQFDNLKPHRIMVRRAERTARVEKNSFGNSSVMETDSSLSIQICTSDTCDGLKKTAL
ncbi:uncharacterized protein LOC129590563 isoform X2 [Paramacrobiotus metropolitanus]|uniref:uncharacterized protein LOC129590563 isoform X2 n=1 Tax=Paramacrobiotus metropolitanus TaxID=2943436 RepID=UPI0024458775|nr:uncharacterized protein LOC129590563 isoform X2 [Paramacrobiotus metropolitanus]